MALCGVWCVVAVLSGKVAAAGAVSRQHAGAAGLSGDLREEAAGQLAELGSGAPPANLHKQFTDWVPVRSAK
ncbi:hypothetical protein Jiend_25610 [Micromonospora endophytica]|nr:hypothetical protein Jiend_25610 [Micromonospora endophytica]